MGSATRIRKRTRAVDEHRVWVPTNLFRGGDECVGGELGAGEDEVVLLGGERLAEHDGVDPGDLANAGGQAAACCDMMDSTWRSLSEEAPAAGCSPLAVPMAVAVAAGDGDGDGELGREGGSSEIRAGAGGVSDGYRWSLSLYKRW